MSEEQTKDKVIEIVRSRESKSSIDTTGLETVTDKIRSHKPSLSIGDITEIEKYGVHSAGININIVAPVSVEDEVVEDNTNRCKTNAIEFMNKVIIPCCETISDFLSSHPEYECYKLELTSGVKELTNFCMYDKLQYLTDELVKSL